MSGTLHEDVSSFLLPVRLNRHKSLFSSYVVLHCQDGWGGGGANIAYLVNL
jgi:hypothetical protein